MRTDATAQTWNVRVVPTGGTYGRARRPKDALVNTGAPMVEVYDGTYADNPAFDDMAGVTGLGQFVSRYYLDTFMAIPGGLVLDGGVPEWWMSADDVKLAQDEVRASLEKA